MSGPDPPPGAAALPARPGLLAVVIPASNEEAYLGACLDALLASDAAAGPVGLVVAANGCRDGTAAVARARAGAAAARGWRLETLEIAEGGKANALNRADAALAQGALGAAPALRAYLDADVVVDPALLGQLRAALDRPAAAYASGALRVAPARSRATRAYARVWTRLPFMTRGVPGAGLFAVNAAGRARWGDFPDIISDDTYVRLLFTPEERIGVPAPYLWPMAEGFARLVRVRRRQNAGVEEIARRWPALMANEGKPRLGPGRLAGLVARRPADWAVYLGVAAAVRLTRRARQDWTRGR
jgi:glycosyltransferase involved in cell wall biosynthesis